MVYLHTILYPESYWNVWDVYHFASKYLVKKFIIIDNIVIFGLSLQCVMYKSLAQGCPLHSTEVVVASFKEA